MHRGDVAGPDISSYRCEAIPEAVVTTGTRTTNATDNGTTNINSLDFIGYMDQKTWSGVDNPPKIQWPRSAPMVIYRDGRKYVFHLKRIAEHKPPVRLSAIQHDYTMTHNRSTSEATVAVLPGFGTVNGKTVSTQAGTGFNNSVLQTSPFTANDQLKLVNKLREKLQGSDFDASVFLGEGNQTLRMLADSAIRIRKAYVHLRRGDVAGSARSLFEGTSRSPVKAYSSMKRFDPDGNPAVVAKNLANNWIELQYGWRPLIKDAAGMAELLAHQLQAPLEMRVSASLRREESGYSPPAYVGSGSGVYYFHETRWTKSEDRRLTVFVKERPNAFAVLGFTRPENLAWELLPWSFVADWFIPIGSYLTARGLSSIYAGTYVQGNLFKGRNFPARGLVNTNGSSNRNTMSLSGWYPATRAHALKVSYVRTVGTSPSVPLPTWKPLAKAASWQHCANAIALLTQQFAGKR